MLWGVQVLIFSKFCKLHCPPDLPCKKAIIFFLAAFHHFPINQFLDLFDEYKIKNFNEFKKLTGNNESNIAAVILKIQEKKTQKGNSYAIVKFTDLSGVFELFIFSDILELNRNILKEGNSVLLTLNKNDLDKENRFKRINVKKIVSIKDMINKPISSAELNISSNTNIDEVAKIISKKGNTEVKFKIKNKEKNLVFKLKNKRQIDRKLINILKKYNISTNIN